jgi:sec-independent protein translocase protein TatB
VERQPEIGSRLLEPLGLEAALTLAIRHHHEWWNGTDYPDGVAGEEIPLAARKAVALSTMFGIGMTELMVIFVIGLIVLGPQRLPALAKSLGKSMAEFRRASTDLRREFMDVADDARIAPEELPDVSDEPPQAGVESPQKSATPTPPTLEPKPAAEAETQDSPGGDEPRNG